MTRFQRVLDNPRAFCVRQSARSMTGIFILRDFPVKSACAALDIAGSLLLSNDSTSSRHSAITLRELNPPTGT